MMSMEATDKGHHWECDMRNAKLEFGVGTFFIPELVAKSSKDVFLSVEEAAAYLRRLIERDVTIRRRRFRDFTGN